MTPSAVERGSKLEWQIKWRLLILPFFGLMVAVVSGYSLLHWLLLQFDASDERLVEIAGPILVSVGAIWWFMKRRLSALSFDSEKTATSFRKQYQALFIPCAFTFPMVVFQHYLPQAVGKVAVLSTINDLPLHADAKFYTLNRYFISRNFAQKIAKMREGIEKHGRTSYPVINLQYWVSCPIFANKADTTRTTAKAWLGITFYETVPNPSHLSITEQEKLLAAFVHASDSSFNIYPLLEFVYLERISNPWLRGFFEKAAWRSPLASPGVKPLILLPIYTPFADRLEGLWEYGTFGVVASILTWLGLVASAPISSAGLQRYQALHAASVG